MNNQTIFENKINIFKTKLANQRTYLAYMRTGIAISLFAKTYNKNYILFFGIFMVLISTIQYIIITNDLNQNNIGLSKYEDLIPVLYGIVALVCMYLQYNTIK